MKRLLLPIALVSLMVSCTNDDFNQFREPIKEDYNPTYKVDVPDYMVGRYSNYNHLPNHGTINISEDSLDIAIGNIDHKLKWHDMPYSRYINCTLTVILPDGTIIELSDFVKQTDVIHLYINGEYIGTYDLNFQQPAEPEPVKEEPINQ